MKNISVIIIFSLVITFSSYSQTKNDRADIEKISKTIKGFLKWYKFESDGTIAKPYQLFKGGYPDTTTKVRIDTAGLEQYLGGFRKSGYISDTYINELRSYFIDKDKRLGAYPVMKELIKIPELEDEFVLHTFEPEAILDHIDESKITNAYIIYKKALVRLHISEHVDMVFALTNVEDKWLIDFLGGDATDKESFFRQ